MGLPEFYILHFLPKNDKRATQPAGERGEGDGVRLGGGEDLEVRNGVRAEAGAVEGNAVGAVGGIAGVDRAGEEAVLGLAEASGDPGADGQLEGNVVRKVLEGGGVLRPLLPLLQQADLVPLPRQLHPLLGEERLRVLTFKKVSNALKN